MFRFNWTIFLTPDQSASSIVDCERFGHEGNVHVCKL